MSRKARKWLAALVAAMTAVSSTGLVQSRRNLFAAIADEIATPTDLSTMEPLPPDLPTSFPEMTPTAEPETTAAPTDEPTAAPTQEPTAAPTAESAPQTTETPAHSPVPEETEAPTQQPSPVPTEVPAPETTEAPTQEPALQTRGYAWLEEGSEVWSDRARKELLGVTEATCPAYLIQVEQFEKSALYEVWFALEDGVCAEGYIKLREVDWLDEDALAELEADLKHAPEKGGVRLPVVEMAQPAQPTEVPTAEPTAEPTATPDPTEAPAAEATDAPTTTPAQTAEVTAAPTQEPAAVPEQSAEPTAVPTAEPTTEPTEEPAPTQEPTSAPAVENTATPAPTDTPAAEPEPTEEPTPVPTAEPTPEPEPTESRLPESTAEPTPEPTPENDGVLVEIVCTITYLDPLGNVLDSSEIAAGAVPEEEFFLALQSYGSIQWYVCNAAGEPVSELPYQFNTPVEGDVVLRALAQPPVPTTPAPTAEPTPAPTAEPTAEPTPVPTAEPTAEPTAAPTAEPTQAPEEIGTATDLAPAPPAATQRPAAPQPEPSLEDVLAAEHPDRSLTVLAAWSGDELVEGAQITLTAEISGYDGLNTSIFWEVDMGEGWQLYAENTQAITFVLDAENRYWQWRAGVNVSMMEE